MELPIVLSEGIDTCVDAAKFVLDFHAGMVDK